MLFTLKMIKGFKATLRAEIHFTIKIQVQAFIILIITATHYEVS